MKIIYPFPQVFNFILERKKISFCLDKDKRNTVTKKES